MPRVTVFIFRHGETDWNKQKLLQGHTDIPLNVIGRYQAQDLAKKLEKLRPKIILSSDLLRAKETATIAAERLHVAVEFSDQLRETRLGDPEGMHRDQALKKFGQESWDKWSSIAPEDDHFAFPNGETKIEVLTRLKNCVEKFIRQNPQFRKLAISTHGGSLRRLLHHSRNAPSESIPILNCALYELSYDTDQKEWHYVGEVK